MHALEVITATNARAVVAAYSRALDVGDWERANEIGTANPDLFRPGAWGLMVPRKESAQ